jgi:tRNA uridine 5-carbamoylmethylation protein Kti12
MAIVMQWSLIKMISMIVRILQNKFDCFIIIEGNRGLGKSTLAIHLARGVARKFKKIDHEKYKFNWDHSLVYTKKETKRFWHKWEAIGIGDEMINVAFNRDFYDTEQKDIVKMINMNRDHRNLFIACVPQFQTLDSQIKNLCKIRITVVRRGVAVIQTPNQTIYIKDKWDQATNEKIEREWMKKGITKPYYTRLTTFRGLMKFPKLREASELKYQEVKDRKRNLVAKEEMGIDEEEQKTDPYEIMIKMLKQGKVKNGTLVDGFALAHGLKPQTFQNQLRIKLRELGEDHKLTSYYWERKAKQRESGSI